ncbi:nitrous oxide reductase family maturation protein NosD [Shewanella woodyi]|uniref:Carbohydrate-binding and sugar hydrolysis n=1 Tax=Shewanella woodyi (strain ATCC 51908 / MS32) TaxID=392500 RepID=B1KK70_SHEWM|nr:nitrous oxide reductase family maturation protein NosD [Shewanella woodyi]ACA88701.1 Carbohydrate-binding and sugar hydrolysis [Shewanella woodyi ATCC 51908]
MRYLGGCCLLLLSCFIQAEILYIDNPQTLNAQLQGAQPYDQLILAPGIYRGALVIDKPLSISNDMEGEVIIDAGGEGSAITITAPDVVVTGLSIRNWGNDHYEKDSGIRLLEGADRADISHNRFQGDGFGISADSLSHITIAGNTITGNGELYFLDRGDGIYLLNVISPSVSGNRISKVRDGIYLETGSFSRVFDNQFSDLQYGIHYMYTHSDEAFGNVSRHVEGGYALMSSKSINLHHNRVSHALDFGVLLNMTSLCLIESNEAELVSNPSEKVELGREGKGVFIYGARDNLVWNNQFSQNDIGIYMAMGGEGNRVFENRFIDNQSQVKYVGDALLEWSYGGRGNYWSSYQSWPRAGLQVGQDVYRPNDNLDRLFWLYPEANFLMGSPIVMLLKWAQREFDIVEDTGIIDSFPLSTPSASSGFIDESDMTIVESDSLSFGGIFYGK